MNDRFWIKTWMFFVLVTVLSCLMMGLLFWFNSDVQHSEDIGMEGKELMDDMTFELWNEFKVLIPIMIILLSFSAWVYPRFVKGRNDDE